MDEQTGDIKAPIRGVPRDCNVRWNSTYLMIESIIEKVEARLVSIITFQFQIHIVNEVLEEFNRERIADEEVLQLTKAAKLLREFYHQTLNVRALRYYGSITHIPVI